MKRFTKKLVAAAAAGSMILGCASSAFAWTTSDEVTDREQRNADLSITAAEEGMVLLRNDGTLPLKSGSKVALYGRGAIWTIKGGTGSGEVNNRESVNYYQGLSKVYDIVDTDYIEKYQKDYDGVQDGTITEATDTVEETAAFFGTTLSGKEIELTDDLMTPAEETDAAIYIISRTSGEGADRSNVSEGDGDYYLSDVERANIEKIAATYDQVVVLLNTANVIDTKFLNEVDGIDAVLLSCQAGQYGGTALANVLDGDAYPSGKLVDTWPVDYMDFASSAHFNENYDPDNSNEMHDEYYYDDIFVGYRYFDTFNVTPAFEFGYGLGYTDFDMETVSTAVDGNKVTVTVKVTNTGDTYSGKEVVELYTSAPDGTLEKPYQELKGYAKTDELAPGQSQEVSVSFNLEDIASYSEDLAAYILEPGDYVVRVGNSSRNTHVAAVLTLGEQIITEQLSNQLQPRTDEDKAKSEKLEEGLVKKDSDTVSYSYDGEDDEIANAQHFEIDAAAVPTENNASPYDDEKVTTYYSENDDTTDSAKYAAKGGWQSDTLEEELVPVTTDPDATLLDVYQGNITMEQFVAGLSVLDLSYIANGVDADLEYGVNYAKASVAGDMQQTEEDGTVTDLGDSTGYLAHYVQGTVWGSTGRYYNTLLIPSVNLPDGPAGPRLTREGKATLYTVEQPVVISDDGTTIEQPAVINAEADTTYYQFATAWPVGVMLAQMWNPDMLYQVSLGYGEEMAEFGVTYLLGPGMNIHRSPLCGRNFEYYSEDPVVTGYTALNFALGFLSNDGVSVTYKHFAGNNNENARTHTNDVVTERAFREIYMKGFEIAVKGAAPAAIMTSYNQINGIYAVNNYDLVMDVLRGEWGFTGLVMSDYGATNQAQADESLGLNKWGNIMHSGNDWIMGGSANSIIPVPVDFNPWVALAGESTTEADEDTELVDDSFNHEINLADTPQMGLGDLQRSCINILYGIMYSNEFGEQMADYVDESIAAPADIQALQNIHNGSYRDSYQNTLKVYSEITKSEVQ